jgi:alpha-L-fucosidase 2
LIQSDEKGIRIFPSIPSSWQELSFHQLGAEGAFLVDAVKYQGSLQQVKIKSLKGNICHLELVAENEFDLHSNKRGIVYAKTARVNGKLLLTFPTEAGETITLKRKNMATAKDLLIHFKDNRSYWGLNKTFLTTK